MNQWNIEVRATFSGCLKIEAETLTEALIIAERVFNPSLDTLDEHFERVFSGEY